MDIKPRILSTAIDFDDQTASLENALAVAEYFGINPPQSRDIAAAVGEAVSGWRNEAQQFGLTSAEINRMATAFEHNDLKAARGKK